MISTFSERKADVARPDNCMVGCTSCETLCVYEAIGFPDKNIVRYFIKEHKVLQIAQQELEQTQKIHLEEKAKV